MTTIYDKFETNFNNNGLATLDKSIKEEVEESLNGDFTLNLIYPTSDKKYKYIVKDNIIKVNTPKGDQLFRIGKPRKNLKTVEVIARHITFDLDYNFLEDIRPIDLSANDALQWIKARLQYVTDFSFYSNISKQQTAYYVRQNFNEAIFNEDNGFLKVWGGEVERDNFNFNILERVGADRGFRIEYGKNLSGIEESIEDEVVTRFMPTGLDANDNTVELPEKYIDSPLIDYYPYPRVQHIHFSDIKVSTEEGNVKTLEQVYTELRAEIQKLINDGVDKYKINYTIDFISLERTEEYKNLKVLQELFLGDTITIRSNKLDIDNTARLLKYTYDCIKKKYTGFELGDYVKAEYYTATKITRKIEQNNNEVTKITQTIKDTKTGLESKIEQTANSITQAVTDANNYTDAQIEITSTAINQRVTNVDFESYKTQTANEISSKVSSSDFSSYVSQTANEISSKVSSGDLSSLIQQDATSVRFAFGSTPSTNLLYNGRGLHGMANWINNGLNEVWLPATNGSPTAFGSKNGFGLVKNSSGEGFLESDAIRVSPGKTYTFTGRFIKEVNVTSFEVYIIGSTNNNRAYDWTSNIVGSNFSNAEQVFTVSFTVPSNIGYIYLRIDHNGSVSSTENYVVFVTDLQLVEGDKVGEWTSHSGEIKTANVEMNGEGLTINDGQLNVVSQGRNIFKVQDGFHYNEWGMACRLANGSASSRIGTDRPGAVYFNSNEGCFYRPFGLYHESLTDPYIPLMLLTNTTRCEIKDLDANVWKGIASGTGEFDSFVYSNSYISGANIINRSLREIKTDITKYDDSIAYEGIKGVNIYNFNMGCNDAEGNPVTSLNLGIMVDEAPIEITQLGGGEGADRQGINLYSYTSYLASALKTAITKIENLENEVNILKGGV